MDSEQRLNQWGQIVTRAWHDDGFKKRLLADPRAVLHEQGVEVAAGFQVRVVENTDRIVHLILPTRRREAELSEAELFGVAAGTSIIGPALSSVQFVPSAGPKSKQPDASAPVGVKTQPVQPNPPPRPL